jgi:hypothetical protein
MDGQRSLLERHRAVMPSWVSLYYKEPIALDRGEGRYVWDTEGHRYLDFFGGILTTMSGHAVPEVVEAIQRQAAKLVHSSTLYVIEPAVRLAEAIARLSPIEDAKVFFVNSGTEATEAALLRRRRTVARTRSSPSGTAFTDALSQPSASPASGVGPHRASLLSRSATSTTATDTGARSGASPTPASSQLVPMTSATSSKPPRREMWPA